ncbi:LHFPL tetraspan subfamily member 6 protein-like [Oratosquilla oratoria]|uniref:LHFPL tetraspan subfamily member 6 protein-like n=1 Tax=Oratosquilla oratoria TaxID=337810 RepID=UPI003F75E314
MASSLTGVGVVWAVLSLTATLLLCTGFYLPYWIKGSLAGDTNTYFGSFRRCNYPRLNAFGQVEIVRECGRYSSFWSIPSAWWQVTTVLVGVGAGLSLLVAVTALAACCLTHVIHTTSARAAGMLQFIAGLLVAAGGALYPLGWDNREVREACNGTSAAYQLGTCEIWWASWSLVVGAALLWACSLLSCRASRVKPGSLRI